MHVKDVEKLTGLSTKAIRLYEEKGLIEVVRNHANDYRDYSEENVQQLRLIKLLRYFEFSLAEIKELMKLSEDALQSALQEKEKLHSKQTERLTDKVDLLHQVVKDLGKKDDWLEETQNFIAYVESEEFQELKEEVEFALLPSLWGTLLQTLMLLGPILWLFTRIEQERYENASFLSLLSLLATIFLTLIWRRYLVLWWNNRKKIRKKNRSMFLWVPITLVSMMGGIAYLFLVALLIESFFLPSDWLFYEYSVFWGKCLIFFIVIWFCLLLAKLTCLWRASWSSIVLLSGGVITATIGLIATTTAVTDHQVIEFNLIVPTRTYSYQEIDTVRAGFGTKKFTLNAAEKQGMFSYKIRIDEKEICFMQPTVNDRRVVNDTYIELEEFNQQLMKLDIAKESSKEGSQYSDLDSYYVERFLRIVDNN